VRAAVVKLSGKLFDDISEEYLRGLVDVLRRIEHAGYRLGVVVGGGRLARDAIRALRGLGVGEAILDVVGIEASRFHASILAKALYPRSMPRPATSIEEALEMAAKGFIPVLGGLQPGQSTNAVAASLAEALGAEVIVNAMKGVRGVYDRRPSEPGARLLERITYREMRQLISEAETSAGSYELLDPVALKIVERSRIKVVFISGDDPKIILKALRGEEGTLLWY